MLHLLRVARSVVREAVKTLTRSGEWPRVRDAHLERFPRCAACGGTARAQVHHKRPFHIQPELELDPQNLLTLCMGPNECHLRIGHGDNFRAYYPGVVRASLEVRATPAVRPRVELEARSQRVLV